MKKLLATIGIISDTHNQHRDIEERFGIPQCDILIHAGDFSRLGTEDEAKDFFAWLDELEIKNKIVIGGNHEVWLDERCGERYRDLEHYGLITEKFDPSCLASDVTYLENESVEINGVKIYGSPYQPAIIQPFTYNWAFNVERDEARAACWEMIPDDTNILITHCPPKGHCDLSFQGDSFGCKELKIRTFGLKDLSLHVFGHVHSARGIDITDQITYINACNVDYKYKPVFPPYVVEYYEDHTIKVIDKWQKL